MINYSFTKLNAAGNDFILFDKKVNPEVELTPQVIKKLSHRQTGIGADGILLISDIDGYAFGMNYYNADGSTGSLCGNGVRCAIWYGKESCRIGDDRVNFIANGTEYSGKVLDYGLVRFYLNQPAKLKYNFKIKAANQLINASYADTGSPHVVINIGDVLRNPSVPNSFFMDLNDFPVKEIGREIRNHKDFAPEGTNVNFIRIENEVVKIRSYERGVEDETLSCGTGSVAAAIISNANYNLKPPINLLSKGGFKLVVDFIVENHEVRDLSLTGPAEITFKGEITI
jgi:diaminopimelate epimerase